MSTKKTKLFISIIAMIVLCYTVSAQEYDIRTLSSTNLRTSSSTNSRIAETVPVGTLLRVIDSSGNWLKINRNDSELWMANWVAHSRVPSHPVASLAQNSQIPPCTNDDFLAYTEVMNELTGDFGSELAELNSIGRIVGFAGKFFKWRDTMWSKLSFCDPLYPIRDDFIVVTTDALIAFTLKIGGITDGDMNPYAIDFRERWDAMLDYADEVVASMS